MRKIAWLLIALFLTPLAAHADTPLEDPAREAAAQDLMRELRCLVCQGQSIAESDAEMAVDMRALVRERIDNGEQPVEVRNYLIRRYGEWVTFSPPKRGANLILWFAPVLLLGAGMIVAVRMFRRRPGE
ncbi:cytochrome c-type biogenesis protein CcmH [Pacificimonas sp. WHA3]|uniref:Cytochrome c-type biogenesis protein n=1 Tax=Pacificimonas pallii TaxID=2827236 RepID=A0ABS6SD29_9SPHN|nr:cytochrome c-type biogenesis protein [Pacificimonas pallii]MBV7256329.1 cytochrome c-type biogenesis protein CcmH [Pacificimonas pallii]